MRKFHIVTATVKCDILQIVRCDVPCFKYTVRLMKKAETRSLVDQVYDILWQEIVQRHLKPNQKLDIKQLAAHLEVSRTPIMEALARLESDGLVSRRNRVGTFVAPVDKAMLLASFASRDMVEQFVTPAVAEKLTADDISALRKSLDTLDALISAAGDTNTFDYASYTRHDHDFHVALVSRCDNPQIITFYRSLNSHMQIARGYSNYALKRAIEGLAEHRQILQAFINQDIEQARTLQHAHLERSRAGVMQVIEEHGVL